MITFRSEKGKSSWSGAKGRKQIVLPQREEQRIRGEALQEKVVEKQSERQKEYNRARNNISFEKVKEISDSEVLLMSDITEIKKHFAEKFEISVENFENKKLEDVSRVLAGIDDIARNYPDSTRYISRVKYDPTLRHFGKITGKEIRIGPSGIYSYATGIHESIHALDFERSIKDPQYADRIIEQARKTAN